MKLILQTAAAIFVAYLAIQDNVTMDVRSPTSVKICTAGEGDVKILRLCLEINLPLPIITLGNGAF